jgi:hypothetical protein
MQIQPPDQTTPLYQYLTYVIAVLALALHESHVKAVAAKLKALIFTRRSPQPQDPSNPQ